MMQRKRKKIFFQFEKSKIFFLSVGVCVFLGSVVLLYFIFTAYSFTIPNLYNPDSVIVKPELIAINVFAIEKSLKKADIKYKSIKELDDESGIEVELENGIIVIFSKSKTIDSQVSSLQALITQLTINIEDIDNKIPSSTDGGIIIETQNFKTERVKMIDFRKSRPLVTF